MDEKTIERMKKMVEYLDKIWTEVNNWYVNKGLLELP